MGAIAPPLTPGRLNHFLFLFLQKRNMLWGPQNKADEMREDFRNPGLIFLGGGRAPIDGRGARFGTAYP